MMVGQRSARMSESCLRYTLPTQMGNDVDRGDKCGHDTWVSLAAGWC